MSSLMSPSDIEKMKLNELIIKDTALQVIKDFSTFGMEVSFPADLNYAYESLFDQLQIIVTELIRKEPERLSSLLYQIDLDEKKLKSDLPVLNESEVLSRMILEREFLKVVTRYYFRDYKP